MIESIGRGVLDRPLSRATTAVVSSAPRHALGVVPASEPGLITTGRRGYTKAVDQCAETIGRGVWVPAFAGTTLRKAKKLPRRALGEDALQGAAVHVEPPRGFGDVAVAHLVDALDMFPAHPVRRHRIVRQLGFLVAAGQ
jgi:hypothetical protein